MRRSGETSGAVSDCGLGREIRGRVVGLEREVPLYDGGRRPYVNLDNAATTPPLQEVADGVSEFLEWYGSVHRGTGAKSFVSTHSYDRCREIVGEFLGADMDRHTVIFTRSTTDSINKVARMVGAEGNALVLCTMMEHHSNLLPWRANCRVQTVDVRSADGSLDLDEYEERLRRLSGEVRLVAVTGASNVTGLMPPIRAMARLAHEHGAEILVDGAQLVPHRVVSMGAPDDPARLDYLAFSAHKMYAPFGVGVLVGPRAAFEKGIPDCVGGGTVRLVTAERMLWADVPAREEAGTPNLVGALALAKAIKVLDRIGMDRVAAHDEAMRRLVVEALDEIPGIRIYGEPAPEDHGQLGVIGFLPGEMNHSLLAAALGHEWAIGVRHGCFCAHPYLMRLFNVNPGQMSDFIRMAQADDHSRFPGLVRISLGIYNTPEEISYAATAIRTLMEEGPRARYVMHPPTGEYVPEEGTQDLMDCFTV